MSFLYKLNQNIQDLSALYLEFGEFEDVQVSYNRIARNWVRSVAGNFTTREFFFNRSLIQNQMELTLGEELEKAYGQVEQLQLLDIDLPDRFEAARERQAQAVEEIRAAEGQAGIDQQEAADNVRAAAAALQVLVLEALSEASEIDANAEAQVASLQARYEAEGESLSRLASSLGLTTNQLLSYVWMTKIQKAQDNGEMLINVDQPDLFEAFGYRR